MSEFSCVQRKRQFHRKLDIIKLRKMAEIKKRYNQVPHLTKDTKWESNKKYDKHHQQEPRGQPFPSR